MSEYAVETSHLTKKYGTQTSVSDVSLHIRRGRIYGLLGRNGAGKTTLMKMLVNLIQPSSGETDWLPDRIAGLLPQFDRVRKPENLCDAPGDPPAGCDLERAGTGRAGARKEEIVFPVFPWHETAACDRAGDHARPRIADFGRTGQRIGPDRHCGNSQFSANPLQAAGENHPDLEPYPFRDLYAGRRHRDHSQRDTA